MKCFAYGWERERKVEDCGMLSAFFFEVEVLCCVICTRIGRRSGVVEGWAMGWDGMVSAELVWFGFSSCQGEDKRCFVLRMARCRAGEWRVIGLVS
jgi:hypothetical protein